MIKEGDYVYYEDGLWTVYNITPMRLDAGDYRYHIIFSQFPTRTNVLTYEQAVQARNAYTAKKAMGIV